MKKRLDKSKVDPNVGAEPRRDVPSTKFGKAIGDVCLREDWTSVGTLELWIGGDRVAGTVALLSPERARQIGDVIVAWSVQASKSQGGA
jgi:hypothetical protein